MRRGRRTKAKLNQRRRRDRPNGIAVCRQPGQPLRRDHAGLRDRGEAYRLESLGCFGSVARQEANADSDVDVMIVADGLALTDVLTPNQPELRVMAGVAPDTAALLAVRLLFAMGVKAIWCKDGHGAGAMLTELLYLHPAASTAFRHWPAQARPRPVPTRQRPPAGGACQDR